MPAVVALKVNTSFLKSTNGMDCVLDDVEVLPGDADDRDDDGESLGSSSE